MKKIDPKTKVIQELKKSIPGKDEVSYSKAADTILRFTDLAFDFMVAHSEQYPYMKKFQKRQQGY